MSTATAGAAAAAYAARPWQALYRAGDPTDITPVHETMLGVFRAAVAAGPGDVAMHYFDASFTWADIDRQSSALAVALQELGLGHGDRLAIHLQNVPQFVVGMVAAWKTGATLLTVNPMMKPREIRKQFAEIEPKVLITLETLYGEVVAPIRDELSPTAVITTSELDHLAGPPPAIIAATRRVRHPGTHDLLEIYERYAGREPAPVPVQGSDLAQVMYTSGSTGMPKAAMSTQANVVFNSAAYMRWYGFGPDDCCLATAPLVHVTGTVGFVGACVTARMPIVLMYRFDAANFIDAVDTHRVTYTICPHTVLLAVMDHPDSHTRDLTSLDKLVTGQVEQVMEAWATRFGNYVYSIYGATECTSPTHCEPIGVQAPKNPSGKRAIGIPIYNTDAKVVDDDGHEVPVGEPGELVVSGPQVGLGYWNRPDVDVFRDGVYKTGDIAYMTPDGWFFIVDRKKDMIDAAAFKISPLEVENVLYEHPSVREAAVIGVPDPRRGQTVKAFVSLHRGTTATPEEIIAFCRERMAAYKYPRLVEILDELPKSDMGKITKSRLPRE